MKTSELEIISTFIAPWALAREKIPIHMVWRSEVAPSQIIVHLPPEFELDELFNIDEYKIDDSFIIINRLKTPNYFGLIVHSTTIYKELVSRREINIEFILSSGAKYVHTFEAKIIRPLLSVIDSPEKIIINEDTNLNELIKISVKYLGLGRAQMKIEVLQRGEIVSHTDSLYSWIINEILGSKKFLNLEKRKSEISKKEKIWIDPESLRKITEEMIERMKSGLKPLDIEEEVLEEFYEWLKQLGNVRELTKIIYSEVEQLLIKAILNYLERHPSEDVELIDGVTKVIFRSRVTDLIIKIYYRDSLENEYEPLEVHLKVEDQRVNAEKVFEVPINIKIVTEKIDLGL